ncbi:MAG: hypothetical protein K9I68_00310 [Bacteroidales bacterium]|nr:hypothetical protein [Bacteroidales bacterium]MCF8336421.1 hypothetical protein [Bacteroidales bacterium]
MKLSKRYKNYKRIGILSKTHSSNSILICTADPDCWLIDIVSFQRQTKEIQSEPAIIADELPEFIERYENQGFKAIIRTKHRNIKLTELINGLKGGK